MSIAQYRGFEATFCLSEMFEELNDKRYMYTNFKNGIKCDKNIQEYMANKEMSECFLFFFFLLHIPLRDRLPIIFDIC